MRLDDLPDVLTIKDTAAFLGVSDPTIRRMIANDELHANRVLTRWRIPKWAVESWLNNGKDTS